MQSPTLSSGTYNPVPYFSSFPHNRTQQNYLKYNIQSYAIMCAYAYEKIIDKRQVNKKNKHAYIALQIKY